MKEPIIHLHRFDSSPHGTRGMLHVDGRNFATIERPWRGNERWKSCIPADEYTMIKRTEGQFYKDYNEDFDHKWVWEVAEVPGRSDILFHIGNWPRNSHGCILVGKDHVWDQHPYMIGSSTKGYLEFYHAMDRLSANGLPVTLKIWGDQELS